MLTNLIPYPRIKFLSSSYNTFDAVSYAPHLNKSINEITKQAFDPNNFSIDLRKDHRKYMSCNLLYRGPDIQPSQTTTAVQQIKENLLAKFV